MELWSSIGDEKFLASEKLIQAVAFNKVGEVLEALKDGADINHVRFDISPILTATMRSYEECVDVLLEHKTKDVPNRYGWTAFLESCIKERPELLTMFLSHLEKYTPEERGTIIKAKDKKGFGALSACLMHNRLDNAKSIVMAETSLLGAPHLLQETDNEGSNLALQAVKERNLDFLEWFLEKGVSPTRENNFRQTALSVAQEAEWEDGLRAMRDVAPVSSQVPLSKAPSASSSDEADQDENKNIEQAPASNPFGLGVKKKRLG